MTPTVLFRPALTALAAAALLATHDSYPCPPQVCKVVSLLNPLH